jgi:biopolymer transport protein ExbD
MTPMIDVVFLLIIFFSVSSHLARQEVTIPVSLPIAASGEQDAPSQLPRLTLTVQADGSVWLAGKSIDSVALRQRLQAALAAHGADVELRVRGSRDAPYQVVEPVMAAAAETGIWNLTFAVMEREATR